MKSVVIIFLLITSCKPQPGNVIIEPGTDSAIESSTVGQEKEKEQEKGNIATTLQQYTDSFTEISTGSTTAEELINFARSLIGVPYKYGSTDPAAGFDCSGFITYVFNHFNISVPRSSVDFTSVGKQIQNTEAKAGDIILFTGTDSAIRIVGHMGIVVSGTNGEVEFIHSTSGKANGVTITPLNTYYTGRYVKTIRIFKGNDKANL